MIALTVREIAEAVEGQVILAPGVDLEQLVNGVVDTDSRLIRDGDVFVAKRGEQTDGHRFVQTAADAGASLAIVEEHVDVAVTQVLVRDSVAALGSLAGAVVARAKRDHGLKVIAITGSNGKTTTKNLVAKLLAELGETVSPRASYNNEVGAPVTMLQVRESTKYLVSEMGASKPGAIAALASLAQPDVGVVLKVGLAHAGEFGGIEVTQRSKSELVRAVPASGSVILNADDPRVIAMRELSVAPVSTFGLHDESDLWASEIRATRQGTAFRLHFANGEAHDVQFRVLGEHHVMNAAAAALVAFHEGLAPERIVAVLESVAIAEPGRMEPLTTGDTLVINDAYNASPDSVAAALRTLAHIRTDGGRTIAVLGPMTELGEYAGEAYDGIAVQAVRLGISLVVVVGDDARRLFLETIAQGSWDGEAKFAADADAALQIVEQYIRVGDTVLVKASNSVGLQKLAHRIAEAVQ